MSSDYPELSRPAAEPARFAPEPGLTRRILANNPKLMLVEHRMVAGWVGGRHRHPHDQLVYVIAGHLTVHCGGAEPFDVRAGDSFVLRGGVEHQAVAHAASHVLDVFTPAREDYLPEPDR